MLLKVILIASLVKLLLVTESPLLCAGIYAAAAFFLGLLYGIPIVPLAIGASVSFGLAFAYFWLLDRFEDSGLFWVILAGGLFIGLI